MKPQSRAKRDWSQQMRKSPCCGARRKAEHLSEVGFFSFSFFWGEGKGKSAFCASTFRLSLFSVFRFFHPAADCMLLCVPESALVSNSSLYTRSRPVIPSTRDFIVDCAFCVTSSVQVLHIPELCSSVLPRQVSIPSTRAVEKSALLEHTSLAHIRISFAMFLRIKPQADQV